MSIICSNWIRYASNNPNRIRSLSRDMSAQNFLLADQSQSLIQNPAFWLTDKSDRLLIFKIRPNILIGLQKLRLRPKDQSRSWLFIYWNFLRRFSYVLHYKYHTTKQQATLFSSKMKWTNIELQCQSVYIKFQNSPKFSKSSSKQTH